MDGRGGGAGDGSPDRTIGAVPPKSGKKSSQRAAEEGSTCELFSWTNRADKDLRRLFHRVARNDPAVRSMECEHQMRDSDVCSDLSRPDTLIRERFVPQSPGISSVRLAGTLRR